MGIMGKLQGHYSNFLHKQSQKAMAHIGFEGCNNTEVSKTYRSFPATRSEIISQRMNDVTFKVMSFFTKPDDISEILGETHSLPNAAAVKAHFAHPQYRRILTDEEIMANKLYERM